MEFLQDLFESSKDILFNWPLGTIFGIIMILVVLLVLFLVGWGLFVAIDSWFLPRKLGMGRIVVKKFIPAHTESIYVYNAVTKMPTTTPIHYPDEWKLTVMIEAENGQNDISVDKDFYDSLNEGDLVMAEYVIGRISGDVYLKNLSRI